LKWMDVILLILAWFPTCMFLCFDQIWFVLGSMLLGSFRCSWLFLVIFIFFGIWFVLFKFFFLYFWVYNLFYGFGFVFRLFSSQTNILGSVYGRTKNFKSTRSGWIKNNWDKGFNTLFGLPCFVKGFFFV
jgi:hypothetical protein